MRNNKDGIFGILHMPSKVLDIFLRKSPAKQECCSGKCQPRNEGCRIFLG
jgi:hypothetical protein